MGLNDFGIDEQSAPQRAVGEKVKDWQSKSKSKVKQEDEYDKNMTKIRGRIRKMLTTLSGDQMFEEESARKCLIALHLTGLLSYDEKVQINAAKELKDIFGFKGKELGDGVLDYDAVMRDIINGDDEDA